MCGLIQGDCKHDRQEFVDCSNYEQTYKCLGCGETIISFIECQ